MEGRMSFPKTAEERRRASMGAYRKRKAAARPGSPCERCNRGECPPVCFPLRDWDRRNRR